MSHSRISQLWPSDLKEQLQTLVGTRRMTEYTIQAVREKIARDAVVPDEPVTRVEFPPAAIQPIPASVVELPACEHGSEYLDSLGKCWLCS